MPSPSGKPDVHEHYVRPKVDRGRQSGGHGIRLAHHRESGRAEYPPGEYAEGGVVIDQEHGRHEPIMALRRALQG